MDIKNIIAGRSTISNHLVAKFVLAALLFGPAFVFAFGLGEIEINSALNEPMDADIELVDFQDSRIDELQVELANQEVFDRIGVPRPYILTRLKFTPTLSASGKPIIKVTSTDPVREPFLTFLVDARWANGKLLREYTVLLDPPVFGDQAKAALQSPKTTAQPRAPQQTTATTPKPATTISSRPPVPRDTSNDISQPRQVVVSTPPSNTGEQQVVVKRGDTLWSIAEPLAQQEGVSVNQMMLAIQSANPQGFTENNINSLNSGAILRVPEDVANQYSSYEALQEVKRQWESWTQAPTNIDSSNTVSESPNVGIDAADATDSSTSSQLSILGEDDASKELSGEGVPESLEGLRNQVNLLRENAESKGQENQELLARIESLESMLEKQENIISLQNEQLAQFQNVASNDTDTTAAETTAPAEPEAIQPELNEVVPAIEEPVASSSDVIRKAVVEPLPDFSGPIPDDLLEGDSDSAQAQEPLAAVEPTASAESNVSQPQALLDTVIGIAKEHSRNLLIGGAVLLALIVVWMIAKRRGSDDEEIAASGLPEVDDEMDDTFVASPDNVDETLDQLDPIDPDGMREPSLDSLGEDESQITDDNEAANDDVLAEADVYISYSLYQQAEELLKDALEKDPSNTGYQVKLAEVYQANDDQDGFVNHLQSIAPNMDKQSSAWTKIAAIGAALVPGHALLSDDESTHVETAAQGSEQVDQETDDNSIDFTADLESTSDEEELLQDDDLEASPEDEFEEDSGTAIMEAAGLDFGVDQQDPESDNGSDETMAFSIGGSDTQSDSDNDLDIENIEADQTEAFVLDDDELNKLDESKNSQESEPSDVFIDLDQDSLEKELSADPGSEFSMDLDDKSSDQDEDLEEMLNSNSDTSIIDTAMFEESKLEGSHIEEDTVSLEQVQNNLTAELETLSFDGGDIDLDNDEASLPTLQTKELGRDAVDLDNIHNLDEDLTASETGTFEADMLAGNVTEQFDANNLDEAIDELGDLTTDDGNLDSPSISEEVGTKLDLARAFVDMGDEDAAKETLTEVIDMGDENQIAAAKEILSKLN
ncbi:MAG: FimV/HubP family polar landmark protein [Pseudomonadota bacterium]